MRILLPIFALLLFSCTPQEKLLKENTDLLSGSDHIWRGVLHIPGGDLPFNFELKNEGGAYTATFMNGDERLKTTDISFSGDTVIIPGYIFESEIRAKIVSESQLQGVYRRLDTEEPYEIPFTAMADQAYRFKEKPSAASFDYNGKWEVTFTSEGDTSKAIGLFAQQGNEVTGTFLTATGDYRYLQGQVAGDTLQLSCFDGAHAFLFTALPDSNGIISGQFWSGKHWNEQWIGIKNEDFVLSNADTLTYLKEGYDRFTFSFPDSENGDTVSSEDDRFKNKVTIVQIMGSWCPNCMDETIFLAQLTTEFPELEVVALAFEKTDDFVTASQRVNKVKSRLGASYPFLIARTANKEKAAEVLPMLNHVLSYPTAILIDKKGTVRHIHTGFSGPGTGNTYQQFTEEYVMLVKKLLREDE